VPLSRNLGTLTSWNPLGHSRPVTGLLYLYIVPLFMKSVSHETISINAAKATKLKRLVRKGQTVINFVKFTLYCIECVYVLILVWKMYL
jgi:hypothetical protein